MMKKLFLTLCVALLSMGAQAQEKGDFALGVKGGVEITKLKLGDWIDESTTRSAFGIFGQYNFGRHWRWELEGMYHPKKDHVSDFQAGLNVQYLIHVTDGFKIYPTLGYALGFYSQEEFTEKNNNSTITVEKDSGTDGGIQLGLGLQGNLGENWFILGEYKFQPGIFGDGHVIQAGIGYRF